MPIRKCTATNLNEVVFHDNLSNSDIKFSYRMPTTKERTEYQNFAIQRRGRKTDFRIAEAQLKFGLSVLEGIREGDFEIPASEHEAIKTGKIKAENQEYVKISSDKKSEYYVNDWKKQVEDTANHLVIALGRHVFDNPNEEGEESENP